MTKRLAVIDGKSVFYRGYYAMPGLSTRDGTPTGGVFGFATLALELIKKLEPDYVAVAWDKKGTSIRKRLEILPTYKAGRKTPPDDFFAQIPMLHDLLDAFSWPLYELDDYEADDIMGALSTQASAAGIETCLITSDLDMLQLVGSLTHVYALKKGLANLEMFNLETFEQKYGIEVDQFVDLKSLMGDSSDNIPGVPGVGVKTAVELLQQYSTLDSIYEHITDIKPTVAKKLVAGKESAYTSKKVAQIWCDAPITMDLDAMDANDLDTERVAALLRELEFSSLVKKLPKNMQKKPATSDTTAGQESIFGEKTEPAIQPFEVVDWPKGLTLEGASETLLSLHPDTMTIWVSIDNAHVLSAPLASISAEVWSHIASTTVTAYDLKALYHTLHDKGVVVRFDDVHDIRQAAFLIDPLQRDRSIAGLSGEDIDESNPGQVVAALCMIREQQIAAFEAEPRVASIAHDMDFPLTYMLFQMESMGLKIDIPFLEEMSQSLGAQHKKLEQEMYSMVGSEFNIASPAQLSEVLFTKLQLPTAGIKKGKTAYSTGQKELDKLRGQHPIIELIEQTRELAKLKNTYVDTLPKLADANHRVHTTFNQDVASTGRLSSTGPNLQNIPVRTELGRKIREAFVPEKGMVYVSADYSQFELRLAAILAGDKELIDDFNGDIDVHTKTASQVYGVPMSEVTKNQRRDAKVINFGVLYGMSPHGLSAATGMNFTEAKAFIDQYFSLRAPIRTFIDQTLQQAEIEGYVETYHGRRRPTPDVSSSNYMVREGAKRAAANMPIQGTEADLMKLAMLKVDSLLGDLGRQVLQVHDSILIECPAENAEKVSTLLKETMESIAPDLGVKLRVDVSSGNNWGAL